MNKSKGLILIIFISFIAISSISGCIDQTNDNVNDFGGEEFSFQGLDGLNKNLSDYRGKIVILDMWATWCSPCGRKNCYFRHVGNLVQSLRTSNARIGKSISLLWQRNY